MRAALSGIPQTLASAVEARVRRCGVTAVMVVLLGPAGNAVKHIAYRGSSRSTVCGDRMRVSARYLTARTDQVRAEHELCPQCFGLPKAGPGGMIQ